MAHSPDVVDIPCSPAMDQSASSFLLPNGRCSQSFNVRLRQQGVIEKRMGMTNEGNWNLSTATGLWGATVDDTLYCGVQRVYTENTGPDFTCNEVLALNRVLSGGGNWTTVGCYGSLVPERRTGAFATYGGNITQPTVVAIEQQLFVSHIDTGTLSLTITIMNRQGQILQRRTDMSVNYGCARLIYVGTTLYVVYRLASGGGTTIQVATVNQTTLGLSGVASLGTTLRTSADQFDCEPLENVGGTDTQWVIAYPETANTIRVRVMTGSSSTTTTTIATAGNPSLVSIVGDTLTGKVAVGYLDGGSTTLEIEIMSTALAGATNTTVGGASATYDTPMGIVRKSSTQYCLAYSDIASVATPTLATRFLIVQHISTAGVLLSDEHTWEHLSLAAKPIAVGPTGQRQVLILCHTRNTTGTAWTNQAAHVWLDVGNSNVNESWGGGITGIAYDHVAQNPSPWLYRPARIQQLTDTTLATAYAWVLQWADPNRFQGYDIAWGQVGLATESLRACSRKALGVNGALYVTGGALIDSDAPLQTMTGYKELGTNGFIHAPSASTALVAGGSQTSGTTYTYKCVYAWTDARGRVWRSMPSDPVSSVPSGGNLTTRLHISSIAQRLALSDALGPDVAGNSWFCVVEVYRSWLGSPYYLATTSSVSAGQSPAMTLALTIDDTFADTTVQAAPAIYTDLGILPTMPPSGARLMCASADRMFVVGWRENVIQFSKSLIATAPVEFVDDDSFRIFCPEPITAIEWFDETLIIFSAHSIYVVSGDGPTDQGAGQYPPPRRLPVDIGCSDWRSVVVTQRGLMWYYANKSSLVQDAEIGRTFFMMARGLGPPQPVGHPVMTELGNYPYVMSACETVNAYDAIVSFLVGSSDVKGANTETLVWDVDTGFWSIDTNYQLAYQWEGQGYRHDLLGSWTSAGSIPTRREYAGVVNEINTGGNPVWNEMRLVFGDWRPFGAVGQGRVSAIGLLVSATESSASAYINAVLTVDGTVEATRQWLMTTSAAAQHRTIIPKLQAGTGFQLTLYDSVGSGGVQTAPSWRLHGISIETQAEPGIRRLANSEVL